MNLHYRIPANPEADSFTRKDIVRDIAHEVQPNMQGKFYRNDKRSHDKVWPERRDEAMTRFAHRVLQFVEPMGYIGPMADAIDIRELTASQCIVHKREHRMGRDCVAADIAPEWLRLQANGVDCVSMYSTYTDENGEEHEVGVEAAERMASEAIAQQLDANIEEFLRRADEQRWYSSRPKVAVQVATPDGRRGLVPKANHPWTREELKALAKSMRSTAEEILANKARWQSPEYRKRRALHGLRALLTPQELDAMRHWEPLRRFLDTFGIEVNDTNAEDYAEEQQAYVNTIDCPNCGGSGWDWTEEGIEEDCLICQGSGAVLQTLGFEGVPVAEPGPAAEMPASANFSPRTRTSCCR